MRTRLLLSTLAAVTVAIVLLGLPLAVAFQWLAQRRAVDLLTEEANRLAQLEEPEVREELFRRVSDDDLRIVLYARGPQGPRPVLDTGGERPLPDFDEDLQQAQRTDEVGSAAADGTLVVTIPFPRGLIRLLQDDRTLHEQVRAAWLSITALAFVSLLAATVAAIYQGKRFAVPLEHLAASARRLGDGDFSARAPRSGLPEPDEVAAALDSTATRLAAMLERSRSFNADASHQLRTPLTALRLDLEALEAKAADPALVEAALMETDRLESTIDELLALAEPPRGDEHLDLAALASERLDAWRSLARAQGREVALRAEPVPPVRARAAALGQSLQVLLDNALEHGNGTITVSVSEVAGGGVRLCVSDEGPGIARQREDTLFDGTSPSGNGAGGRGLPLARSLVEAEGGRIALERARPGAAVCLLLPADSR